MASVVLSTRSHGTPPILMVCASNEASELLPGSGGEACAVTRWLDPNHAQSCLYSHVCGCHPAGLGGIRPYAALRRGCPTLGVVAPAALLQLKVGGREGLCSASLPCCSEPAASAITVSLSSPGVSY